MSYFNRQTDLINMDEISKLNVTIIGVGAIGSWAAVALTRLGVKNLTLVDPDIVEMHNVANQAYGYEYIGRSKVDALSETLSKIMPDIHPVTLEGEFNLLQPKELDEVIISGLDSMAARRDLWGMVNDPACRAKFYIDGRMGGELIKLYSVNGGIGRDLYQLDMDSETGASEEPCTARSIIYNTQVCGGLIAAMIKKYVSEEPIPSLFMFDLANLTIV